MSKYIVIPKDTSAIHRVIEADKMNESWKSNSNTVILYQGNDVVAVVSMDNTMCILKAPEQEVQ